MTEHNTETIPEDKVIQCDPQRVTQFIDILTERFSTLMSNNPYGGTIVGIEQSQAPLSSIFLKESTVDFSDLLSGKQISKEAINRIVRVLRDDDIDTEFHGLMKFLVNIKYRWSSFWYVDSSGKEVALDSYSHETASRLISRIREAIVESPAFKEWIKEQELFNEQILLLTPFGIFTPEWVCMYRYWNEWLMNPEKFTINGRDCYQFEVHDGGQSSDIEVKNDQGNNLFLPGLDWGQYRVRRIKEVWPFIKVIVDSLNTKYRAVSSDGIVQIDSRSFLQRLWWKKSFSFQSFK